MSLGLLSTAAPPLLMISRLLIVARTGCYRTQNIIVLGIDFFRFMWYHACMKEPTNDIEIVLPYDDCDLEGMSDTEIRAMLQEEGYPPEEIDRMMGLYEADDYCYDGDDLDRDVPDFMDGGDFE